MIIALFFVLKTQQQVLIQNYFTTFAVSIRDALIVQWIEQVSPKD